MAKSERHYDDNEDALHHSADRRHDVLAGWIIAILLLFVAALPIGFGRLLDRAAEIPANFSPEIVHGTEDMLIKDHTFAPDAIVVHPNDRIVLRNVGKDSQELTLVGHEDILQDLFVEPGGSFTFVIPPALAPGTYRLLCTTHDNMSATLIVRSRLGGESSGAPFGALLGGGGIPARSERPGASIDHGVPTEKAAGWHSTRAFGSTAIDRPQPLGGR